jgi:predicted enzyme related to lactoylglutathione lyase
MDASLLCKVDAVTVPVPDLDSGLEFYAGQLRHRLAWRNDDIGQAAVALRDSDTEIVLTTRDRYEPNWLVEDVEEAAAMFDAAGGRVLSPAFDIPVGRVAVVADPFDNVLVLVDLSKGRYRTADDGTVTGVVDEGP